MSTLPLVTRVAACLADCAASIEWAAQLIDAPERCAFRSSAEDARALLRELDKAPLSGPAAFLGYCEARRLTDPANAEFWQRLAGSVRKAMTL